MTLHIDFSPQASERLAAAARSRGVEPKALLEDLVVEHLPPSAAIIDGEKDATIALLQSWLDEDATNDPDEIRAAEEELAELKRNMNAPRKEAGERLLFPDVE